MTMTTGELRAKMLDFLREDAEDIGYNTLVRLEEVAEGLGQDLDKIRWMAEQLSRDGVVDVDLETDSVTITAKGAEETGR